MNGPAALTVGSVCTGVGGLDRGLHRAGHRIRWHCEQDRYRRRVLARHWPDVPCHPDLERLARDPAGLEPVDVLAGGTPCPDFSTAKAGRRGLEGDKSRLFWNFAEFRNRLNVEWTVWENVDGALSTHEGMDFALVLGAFVGADIHVPRGGWPRAGVVAGPWGGCVWRVLAAQHFGTPQRRHRLFVVGRLGGPCPPEVLLEPQGGGGDSASRRPSRQESARALGSRVAGTLGASPGRVRTDDLDGHGAYVAAGEPVVTAYRKAQKAHHADDGERWEPADAAPTLSAAGGDANATIVVPYNVATAEGGTPIGAREARHAAALRSARGGTEDAGTVVVTADVAATLTAFAGGGGRCEADDLNLVAYMLRSNGSRSRAAARETDIASALLAAGGRAGGGTTEETIVLALAPVASTLTAEQGRGQRFPFGQEDGQLVITLDGLRRLSPTECERLQGLPDGWTCVLGERDLANEDVRALREAFTSRDISRMRTRLDATEVLRSALLSGAPGSECEFRLGGKRSEGPQAGAAGVLGRALRVVWYYGRAPIPTPQGWRPDEQLAGECRDPLPWLSHLARVGRGHLPDPTGAAHRARSGDRPNSEDIAAVIALPYRGPSLLDTPAWHERDPADQPAASPWDPPDRLDTPRRSACGDAVNAAVAEWIGRRLGRCAAAAARR